MSTSPLLPSSLLKSLEADNMPLGTSFGPYHTVAPPVNFDPFKEDDTLKLPPKGSSQASTFLPGTTWPPLPTKGLKYPLSVAPPTSPATVYYSSSAPSGSTPEYSCPPTPASCIPPYASIASGPRVVVSAKLQPHFNYLQVMLPRICNRNDIVSGASWACVALMLADDTEPVKALAKKIIRAGAEDGEYTRSVALFARQLFDQFRYTMCDATRPAAERDTAGQRFAYLIRIIDTLVWQSFMVVWGEIDTDDPVLHDGLEELELRLESDRTHLLNTTAFVGDLFAAGALSSTTMCTLVRWLAGRTTTLMHCRGLHLLLSRMTIPGMQTLCGPFLEELRQTLAESTMYEPLFVENINAQRWLQEIGDVITRITEVGGCELACSPFDIHAQRSYLNWDKISCILSNKRPRVFSRPKGPSRVASLLGILNRRS